MQGDVRIELGNKAGQLKSGRNDVVLVFRKAATGETVAVRNVRLELFMPAMGAMPPMLAAAKLTEAGTGQWGGDLDIPMSVATHHHLRRPVRSGKNHVSTHGSMKHSSYAPDGEIDHDQR